MKSGIEKLWKNPDFQAQIKKSLALLKKQQSELTGPKKAKTQKSYQKILENFGKIRGGKLFYPYLSSGIGNGALVELMDGSVKYDLINGIGVHPGHSMPELIKASIKGAFQDTIMQGNLQQNHSSYELAKTLSTLSGLEHCFLTSSGAMALENALKIAFQKNAPANRVLAFRHCFSGRTLALASVTDKAAYRDGLPKTLNVDYIPFYDEKNPKSIQYSLEKLDRHLKKHPQKHAAMIVELIQGEGGYYPGKKAFFIALFKVLRKHKIAIIIDEVQSFGRTNRLFAFQYFGLERYCDILCIGKLSQVCATLFKKEFKPKPGLISQTFTSSSTAIESSLALIKMLCKKGVQGKGGLIDSKSQYFREKLQRLEKKYPDDIQGPYGIGAMIAFQVYDGSKEKTITYLHRLFDLGVMGFIAGNNPIRIRFLLPYLVLRKKDIDKIIKIIENALVLGVKR